MLGTGEVQRLLAVRLSKTWAKTSRLSMAVLSMDGGDEDQNDGHDEYYVA